MTIYYLGYGSNLHPLRLRERVPSASLVGTTRLSGYQLHFHKRGMDGSGKCNLLYTGDETHQCWAAVFSIKMDHKPLLDRYEGSGYATRQLETEVNGDIYSCFAYIAEEDHIQPGIMPYHWYKQIVATGASYLGFPQSYCASISAVSSKPDLDNTRHQHHQVLLQKMLQHGAE